MSAEFSCILRRIENNSPTIDLHKPPTSIVDSDKRTQIFADNLSPIPDQQKPPLFAKRPTNGDDTESDYELNVEPAQTKKVLHKPELKAVDKVRLDVAQVLKDEGVPVSFVANHQQLLTQVLTGKPGAANTTVSGAK